MKALTRTIIAVALGATSLIAQQPPQQTEVPKLMENVDVRVINVDVVVTDRKGNTVSGLKAEDFEIYENGVPKPVSNFYEIERAKPINVTPVQTPATPPAAATARPVEAQKEDIPDNLRRRIIFFIDNLSLAPFNRNKVFKEMKEFAKTSMRPGDEAMIATFNRSMKVRMPFTRDAKQIESTLEVIAGESALGLSNKSERKDVQGRIKDAQSYDDAVATARSYAASVEHDLRQSVESLNGLMSTLAGVEGKKILVLTSEGFPMQPGKDAFYYIDEVARQKNTGNWQSGSAMLEGMSFDSTSLIQSIARTANANGITLYPIHAGGLDAGNDNSAENAAPTSFTVSQAVVSNSTDSLRMMAEMTGGLASIQTNNFKGAFDKIRRDLDAYYSLGYRAGTERVDRQRGLEVRVKNRAYQVRGRQTFVEKSTYAEMSDRVIANLLYKTKANELNIRVIISAPQAADEYFKVPVEVQIPMDSLTLLPLGEDQSAGGFDLYVAVANKEGDMSDVSRKMQQIRVSAADYKKLKGKYYTYSLDHLMEPGMNKVSIGVVDQVANT
ncbi:MAG: VWA domain-containing protein, partial [Acidobacteriota bacterium]